MRNTPANLKFAKSHEWASLETDRIVRVGISDFAQQELGDLVFVNLPAVGRQLEAVEQCAVVESVKTASDLFSPVSGKVTSINEALLDEPQKINDDPFQAWLFCIQADDVSELELLMNADDYQKLIES